VVDRYRLIDNDALVDIVERGRIGTSLESVRAHVHLSEEKLDIFFVPLVLLLGSI
jgi:hypothetical protein